MIAGNERSLHVIAVPSGAGAQDPRCEEGPAALIAAGFLDRLAHTGRPLSWEAIPRPSSELGRLDAVAEVCAGLAQKTYEAAVAGHLPVIVGGDHAIAVGTWSGVARALDDRGGLGLLWLDAHMDAHTPDTTPSGALHGMPVAALLGHGFPALTRLHGLRPALLPQHLCLVGIRSFEPGEAALLARLRVRVVHIDEVRRRGLGAVVADALNIVGSGTAGFGVSIDLDVFDPLEEPGVGSAAPDGLFRRDLCEALAPVLRHPNLVGLEIAEYNPYRDADNATAQAAIALAQLLAT
ncbi:MAG: arginase [Betaproteobacteria bacterium]|nr:arginase [Betaproteobacteria bacterium]